MVKQIDLVKPKSPEEYSCHGNTDDEFEEYSEEEMHSDGESNENLCMPPNKEGSFDRLSKVEDSCAEEPNEDGLSDEESAEEVPCGDESDDDDSCSVESNEEISDEEPEEAVSTEYPTEGATLEEAIEEDPTDLSVEEIIEEEFSEESGKDPNGEEGTTLEEASDEDPTDLSVEEFIEEEFIEEEFSEESDKEPNGEESLRGSMDQHPFVNIIDGVPSLLEDKQASDHIFSESKISVKSSGNQPLRESSNLSTDAFVSKQPDDPSASKKRRQSRWDIKAEAPILVNESADVDKKRKTRWSSDSKAEAPILVNDNADLKKRRKTRWSGDETQLNIPLTPKLLDSVKDILSGTFNDRRIQILNAELHAINQKLVGSVTVNEQPQKESSPSLHPNDNGLDTNTLLRLLTQKHKIISELTKSQKNDKAEYSFEKKVYIPSKEYPDYNFIGLLLGPSGNTLKKMEKDTGASIRIRGKGSSKKKSDEGGADDMHVLIQSDSQTCLDAAVSMVEKLLVPVDDRYNYHKAAQLRELAELKAKLGEMKQCDICGQSSHQTSDCPLVATQSQPNANFHAGSGSLFSSKNPLSPSPLPSVVNAYGDIPKRKIDPSTVYVGYLPHSITNDKLKELFQPYGILLEAKVLQDKVTGISKGCGFVKYTTTSDAAKAIAKMHGYMIDGKKLQVRIAGIPPPSSNTNLPNFLGFPHPSSSNTNLPNFPGFASISPLSNPNLPNNPELSAIAEVIPKPNCWPGPPGSILPESAISFPKSGYNLSTYTESVPLQSSSSFGSTFETTSLGKNGHMMDGKKLNVTANLPNYPRSAAFPREILEPNCWPCPSGSIPPEPGTYFPTNSYNSLNYTENVPLRSSKFLGSTCQTSVSSCQSPGVTLTSNELASFPGFLKSFDPSDQLDQSIPPSSLSSRSPYFIHNFSGNKMNPTWP